MTPKSSWARRSNGAAATREELIIREGQQPARDLRKGPPRSPKETLGGYALAARAVDKCRAVLVGWEGDYTSNCPPNQRWLSFAAIDYREFRAFVATGAADQQIAAWIANHAKPRSQEEIAAWNNEHGGRFFFGTGRTNPST